ncbi:MAG: hypothetical protein WEE67_06270 [Chloroflexota bacterium]
MAANLCPRVTWIGVLAFVRAGDPCEGQGGYGDIVGGAQVVVRDGAGEIVATGALDAGVKGADEQCSFTFAVEGIPNAEFYDVEVSHRGELAYSREDMEGADWRLSSTLGD